jgi:hypothetical protein
VTLRRLLPAVAAALALVAGTPASAAPLRLTLPEPTGPHSVGTVSLHLIDPARQDPGATTPRELMISLWYPARSVAGYPRAPWLAPGAAAQFALDNGARPGDLQVPLTHGREGAPVDGCGDRLPVVLYSHGNDSFRSANTMVVEELASRGYLVVTIDHTGDALTEFPDGRLVRPLPDSEQTGAMIAAARVADARFVLNQLAVLNSGGNPDAERHPLPAGLRNAMDLNKVGMFGYSAGAPTVTSTMYEDRRVDAGLSLDGPVQGSVVNAGLDRPYLLVDGKSSRQRVPDLQTFWANLLGWRLDIALRGVEHLSYSDYEVLIPQAAQLLGLTPQQVQDEIGTVDPARAVAMQQAYPLAFFDLHLRHQGHLLDGPSPRFPEVVFIP